MKKILFLIIAIISINIVNADEWTICDLTGLKPLAIYENNDSAYAVFDVSGIYWDIRIYKIDTCDLIDQETFYMWWNASQENRDYIVDLQQLLYITHSFQYVYNTSTYWYYDVVIDKTTNTINILATNFTSAGAGNYNYELTNTEITIQSNISTNTFNLLDNTYTTWTTIWSYKQMPGFYMWCTSYSGDWICFYKTFDNQFIKYDINDITYTFFEDTINQRALIINNPYFILWRYTSNFFWFADYDFTDFQYNNIHLNYVPTNKDYSFVPYSNTLWFNAYDFWFTWLPLIWTNKTSLNSYYIREWVIYTTSTWAINWSFPSNWWWWETSTWVIDTTQCTLDIDNDGDVSFLDGEFFIWFYNCITYWIEQINNWFASIFDLTDTIKDIWNTEEQKDFFSFIFWIEKANASEFTNAFNNRNEDSFLYKIPHFIMWWFYTFLIIAGLIFLINLRKK